MLILINLSREDLWSFEFKSV